MWSGLGAPYPWFAHHKMFDQIPLHFFVPPCPFYPFDCALSLHGIYNFYCGEGRAEDMLSPPTVDILNQTYNINLVTILHFIPSRNVEFLWVGSPTHAQVL